MVRSLFSVFILLLLCVGCGPSGKPLKVEYVEGVITLDGQPLDGASIRFTPTEAEGKTEAAGGFSDARGIFTLTSMNGNPERGAVEGEYKVTISKAKIIDLLRGRDPATLSPYEDHSRQEETLPAIYSNLEQTELTATVKRGRNTIDFHLKSEP
jgi:hypothetical protein